MPSDRGRIRAQELRIAYRCSVVYPYAMHCLHRAYSSKLDGAISEPMFCGQSHRTYVRAIDRPDLEFLFRKTPIVSDAKVVKKKVVW
ncbi:hypothetical protein NQ317_004848 [Molorchus minor]|uniref:Uncharacterized protein n=1 Tax=Molorchus minor TaxID=1323400 RepID=A0ABQ9J843_9CUCU|nr:hypothetical protein NQ317_004848 [Molorchus minor]